MNYRLIATLSLLLLAMVFAVQNAAVVELRFLVWELDVPRWLLIFTMLVMGIVIGWFMNAIARAAGKKAGAEK